MKSLRANILWILTLVSGLWSSVCGQVVNFSPAKDFLELDVHFQIGPSSIYQNYAKNFRQIIELNTNSGTSYGVGAKAVFGISEFLGFGTELNFNIAGYSMDIAVSDEKSQIISNVFLRNRYISADVPVFVSFRFNVSNAVRLNVDFGGYYELGLTGRQKQSIYNTSLNDLGQLIPQTAYIRPPYFKSPETFINSFYRNDLGLYLAAGLRFGSHVNVGVKSSFGLKNVSYTSGLVNPTIHNYSVMGVIGYNF